MKDKNKRPINKIATKTNVDRDDAELLLYWARQATAVEEKPISTRHIIKRLINWFKKNERNGYPEEID